MDIHSTLALSSTGMAVHAMLGTHCMPKKTLHTMTGSSAVIFKVLVAHRILPLTPHFFCIHHLDSNVETNVHRGLGSQWSKFTQMFWKTYHAISPEEFDHHWLILINNFPSAQQYLQDELYPCRSQWAWAYTSFQFTCRVHTNGRVEGENRVNKIIGGPKKSAMQLFDGLNERTTGQGIQDMICVCDSSCRQHAGPIGSVFPALQRSFKEMELSMYYRMEVLQRPDGVWDWNEYAIQVNKEIGYDWTAGEETHMVNKFENDTSYIGTAWLLCLAQGRGLQVQHLLHITHLGHGTTHILAILPNNHYVCDCCMGWYQDRNLDTSIVPPTAANENTSLHHEVPHAAASTASQTHLNPSIAPVPTQTIAARTVFHKAQAAIQPLIAGIQTQEQLDSLLDSFHGIRSAQADEKHREAIHDPPTLNPKGRPRSQRMTGPTEGHPRGGGASITNKIGGSG
ncbi:hypothetical protein BYT27DRAFT_7224672 [Phlegmacium glaucopus]|nr:hypothetical protein BYT27DRAFT_7224672 [Phlegmacium glaucopus]